MTNERDLEVPVEVQNDPNASEVLRAWVVNGGLVCSLRPTKWKDPQAWGLVLADVARHVGNAIRDVGGEDPHVTVGKIREVFNAELTDPTDEPTGFFPG